MKISKEFHRKHTKVYILFLLLLLLTALSALFAFSDTQKDKKTPLENTKKISETLQDEQKINREVEKKTNPSESGKIISTSTAAQKPNQEAEKNDSKIDPDEPKSEVETVSATLRVNGETFSMEVPVGSTVLDLMNTAKEKGYMTFESKDFGGDLGYFIESINGIKSGDTKNYYWIYYINGAKAKIGISNYTIQQNDIITWKYEKSTL